MSRQFDTAAGTDSITFSVGNAPPDQGPFTLAVLAKAANTSGFTGWLARGLKAGTGVWSLLTSNNAGAKLFAENDFGNGVAGLSTSWRWYVVTKAAGSALPRIHVWDLSGAWAHTNNSANTGDNTGPIDAIVVGGSGAGNNGWRGSIAVAAAWASELSDASVEAAMTLLAADTLNATPGWMIRLNQASTATSVTDDTGGGGNQSALSGTTVDADDPSGYDYSLTSSAGSIAPDSLAAAVSLGAPTISQTLTVTPTSLAVTASLGAPTLSQALSVTPASLAATVSLGAPALSQALSVAPTSLTVGVTLGAPTVSQTVTPGFDVAPDSLAVTATLGAPSLSFAAASTGSWETLRSIVREARADHERNQYRLAHPIDCPEHGWPLERTSRGLHCQFGGHVVR